MKNNNNKRSVIVGIFIFLGLAIFVIGVLALGSQNSSFEKSIDVKVFFADVNGLQKGNNVWFSGVKIGKVKKITLTSNDLVEVDLSIDEKSKQFIRSDAKAKVSSDGLIGSKIVVIYGGTMQSHAIEESNVLATEKISSAEEMMSTLAKNNDNLLEITTGFKTIVGRMEKGEGSIGKLLTDETLINDLNSTASIMKKASVNIEQMSAGLSGFSRKMNTKGSLANDLVTDTTLFNSLSASVANLNGVTQKALAVVNNLKGTSDQLNDGLNNRNAPIGMLLHDEKAAANIKSILTNLNVGTAKLDENLEAMQHNFLLRGFFKKKEKREKKAAKDSAAALLLTN